MTDYFDDDANWAKLKAEIDRWMGTPFFEAAGNKAKPKVSADCVSFPAKAMHAAGAISAVRLPEKYVTAGGGEPMLAIFLRIMAGIPELFYIWDRERSKQSMMIFDPEVLKRGDLILCSSGKALHHLAIYCGNNVIVHSVNNERGVQLGNVHDPIVAKNVLRVYRARYDDSRTHAARA